MPHGRTVVATVATSALVLGLLATTGAPAFADGSATTTPTIADSQSSATSADASEIAQAHDHGVTVSDETTPTSLLTANPDGSFTVTQDTIPVRTQQAGQWIPVETDLVPVDQSWIAPKATDTHVRFSRGGTDTLAQVQTDTGAWVSESWPAGGALPSPTIDGATATYADVLPEVDLRLTATPSGMAEVLVVNTPEAAANPDLQQVELQMHGATVSTSSTASTATATDGSTLQSSKPTWWDSSDGGDADGPGGAGSATPLEHTTTTTAVTLDVTDATDTAPTFPVFVDPDWSSGQNALWFDDIAYPTQSYLNGQAANGYQSVGYAVENGKTFMSRAFWQFNLGPLDGKHITEAHFNAIANYSCGEATVQAWRYGNVTPGQNWNDDQANQGQWRDHISDAEIPSVAGCAMPGKAVGWDVTRGAAATAGNTLQIGLRSPTEGSLSRKHFAYNATLTIEYNTKPNTPSGITITSPTRACGTSDANSAFVNNAAQPITLQVKASDPDGGLVRTTFHVMRSDDPDTIAWSDGVDLTSAGPQSVQIPKGALADGHYMFRAKSNDGTDWGGWTGWCYFSSDSTVPNPPTVSGLPASYRVGTKVTATVTARTKDKDIRGFQYWLSDGGSLQPVQPVSEAVTTATGYHSCDLRDGIVVYVCADASGTAKVSFTPSDSTSRLWVKSIDKAANVSTAYAGSGRDGLLVPGNSVAADDDPRVGTGPSNAGHAWSGQQGESVSGRGTVASPTVIGDDSSYAGTGARAAQALTLDPTTSTTPLDVGAIPLGAPSIEQDDVVRVNRYKGGGAHSTSATGKTYEMGLGGLQVYGPSAEVPSNMIQVKTCTSGIYTATVTGACPSGFTMQVGADGKPKALGYAWKTAADVPTKWNGSAEVFQCLSGEDYFLSRDTACEGKTKKWSLGYWAALSGFNRTASAPIDTTKSYTVSAWMKPSAAQEGRYGTAVSMDGPTGSVFYLQWAGDDYRFCVKSQPDLTSGTCVSPARTRGLTDQWTFVTGVWDADNQQIRIVVNHDAAGEGVAYHALGADEQASTGGLRVGGAVSSGGPSDTWTGAIAMPTISQGVATMTQLRVYSVQGTYAY